MDAMGLLLMVELCNFALSHDHSAHAGPHDDADAVRVLLPHLKARVGQRFFLRHEGQLGITVYTFTMGRVEKSFDREATDLACDFGTVAVDRKGIKGRNG